MPYGNPIVGDFPQKLKPAIPRYVLPGWYFNGKQNGSALANGDIIYIPIFVSETTLFTRVGAEITTAGAGGSTLEIRLFAWNEGVPGALIEDFGSISLAAGATVEIVIALTLPRGYYFLAMRTATGVGAILEVPLVTNAVMPPLPGLDNSPAGVARPLLTVASAWANPAPAPTNFTSALFAGLYLREN